MSDTETQAARGERKSGKAIVPLLLAAVMAAENGVLLWLYRPWSHGLPALPGHVEAAEHDEAADHDEEAEPDEERAGEDQAEPARPAPARKKKKPRAAADAHEISVLKLEPFVVNLADQGRHRYARATFQVAFAGKESGAKVAEDAAALPPIRQAVIESVAVRKADELVSAEGKEALRQDIRDRLDALALAADVAEVYITDFLIQF